MRDVFKVFVEEQSKELSFFKPEKEWVNQLIQNVYKEQLVSDASVFMNSKLDELDKVIITPQILNMSEKINLGNLPRLDERFDV